MSAKELAVEIVDRAMRDGVSVRDLAAEVARYARDRRYTAQPDRIRAFMRGALYRGDHEVVAVARRALGLDYRKVPLTPEQRAKVDSLSVTEAEYETLRAMGRRSR